MNLQIEGLEELQAKLKELSEIAGDTMKTELADIALDLAGKCSEAAPVDKGDLRGDLANPRKESDLEWKVGSDLPYTLRQHEHTEYNHPRGGDAKFIERPFRQNVDKYIDAISNAMESELR